MKNETVRETRESRLLQERYDCVHHKSGLDIYVFPKKMSTTYALFGTKYGSIDNCFRLAGEKEYTQVPDGIAHFLEHKMFESEDGSDTNERFTRIGASANAFTSNDMTAYEFSCTGHFCEALEILLDYVTHPYFTEENIQKEQGIIGQEIGMYDDNPAWRIYYELLKLLYVRDNVRINVCGTKESIATITPEHLYRCYTTFYRLSNMALVICGDVETEQVVAVADRILKNQEDFREIERYFKAEPDSLAGTRSVISMDVGKTLFAIGVKDIHPQREGTAGAYRRLALRILSDMLFGEAGTFYNTMYEEGRINSSFHYGYESTRSCGFLLLTGESDDPEEVLRRFTAMVEDAKKNPPSRSDFERLKRTAYAEYIRAFDSTDGIANDLLSDLFAGVDIFSVGDILASVRYEDVLALLSDFFEPERYAMSVIRPDTHAASAGEEKDGNTKNVKSGSTAGEDRV